MDNKKRLVPIKPINLIVFLTFYSPIIIAVGGLGMSFIFQNFKGFIYLGFLLAACIVREFILWISGTQPFFSDNTICSAIEYSSYGNSGISIFVLAFSIMYICLPMFINKDVNFWVFGGLLSYFFVDIGIRYTEKCITSFTDILMNVLTGAGLGVVIPSLLYAGGASKYLFFNEISSNNVTCSMPKKQTFKCAVYKNGELIGSTTK
jgi:hypothetical protein